MRPELISGVPAGATDQPEGRGGVKGVAARELEQATIACPCPIADDGEEPNR